MHWTSKKLIKPALGLALLVIFLTFLFTVIYGFTTGSRSLKRYYINEGWTVCYHGKVYNNVSLDNFSLPEACKKGDVLTLRHNMNMNDSNPVSVRIYTRMSAITVCLNNDRIYNYGKDQIYDQRMTGSGYHFVVLPRNYSGKTLTIDIRAQYDNSYHGLPEIEATAADSATARYAQENSFAIFETVFMMLVSILIAAIGMIYSILDREFHALFLFGCTTVIGSIWQMAHIKILELFSLDFSVNSVIEYCAMSAVCIPMLVFCVFFRRSHTSIFQRIILKLILAANVVCFIVSFILDRMSILPYFKSADYIVPVLIVSFAAMALIGRGKWSGLKLYEKMYQTAFYAVLLFAGIKLVINAEALHAYHSDIDAYNWIVPGGFIVVLILLCLAFGIRMYSKRLDEKERVRLEELAVHDKMTSLYNRTRGDELLRSLDDSHSVYTLVLFDLNGLKKVNDKYGHADGDRYIMLFAEIVKNVFNEKGETARMGGDEFLTVIREYDLKELKRMLTELIIEEKKLTREYELPFDIDASFGIAVSLEKGISNSFEAYKIADDRMYDNKRKSRKARE